MKAKVITTLLLAMAGSLGMPAIAQTDVASGASVEQKEDRTVNYWYVEGLPVCRLSSPVMPANWISARDSHLPIR